MIIVNINPETEEVENVIVNDVEYVLVRKSENKERVLSFDDIVSCTYPYVTFNFNKEGKDYKILDEQKLRELVEKRINAKV